MVAFFRGSYLWVFAVLGGWGRAMVALTIPSPDSLCIPA